MLSFDHAYGVTTVRSTVMTEGAAREVFPFASVTKLMSSYAMLVAVERGLLTLDAPAGGDSPRGTTLRHLLAHASGLPFEGRDPIAEPATRRIYSNTGIEIAGEIVSHACGRPFAEWIEEVVLIPLGMSATVVEGSPAYSGEGTVEDLLIFARELLEPTLISAALRAEAASVQFPGLAGILPGYGSQNPNDWGLGFEIRSEKSPHWTHPSFPSTTFGHFGQSGSFLWVDADAGVAGAFLGERPFGAEHKAAWPDLTLRQRTAGIAALSLQA